MQLRFKLFILFGAILSSIILVALVFQDTSSTASIGLLFIPFAALLGGALAWSMGQLFSSFLSYAVSGRRPNIVPLFVSLFVLLGFAVTAGITWQKSRTLRQAKDPNTEQGTLAELARGSHWGQVNIDAALAENPSTSLEDLLFLAKKSEERLAPIVAGHTKAPAELVNRIAMGKRDYFRSSRAAAHALLSSESAEYLSNVDRNNFGSDTEFRLYQTYVLSALVNNTAVSQTIFEKIAARDDQEYFLAHAVVQSSRSNCAHLKKYLTYPQEVLANSARKKFTTLNCQTN